MDLTAGLISGFKISLQYINLFYCFFGVLIGTLVGVLPGIGPTGAMAMLLPLTFGLSPTTAIIMLAGIYYGAMYGGSTTSILVNIPGEAASVVTCLDGYQMARQGRAGPALGISALGTFIGGTFSIIALMILVFPLAQAADLDTHRPIRCFDRLVAAKELAPGAAAQADPTNSGYVLDAQTPPDTNVWRSGNFGDPKSSNLCCTLPPRLGE
jgi:hypothetical protein